MLREILIDAGDARRLTEGEVVEVVCPANVGPMNPGDVVTLTSRAGGTVTVVAETIQHERDMLARGAWQCRTRVRLHVEAADAA